MLDSFALGLRLSIQNLGTTGWAKHLIFLCSIDMLPWDLRLSHLNRLDTTILVVSCWHSCVSHFARETLNEVFEKDIALFETTSFTDLPHQHLNMMVSNHSFDFKGLTDSKFLPLLHDTVFHRLHDRFTYLNDNTPLTSNAASSKKMKSQTKMISIIRNSLKEHDRSEKLSEFNDVIQTAFGLTQQKRFYISDYGYANVREVILGEQEELVRGQNWDKFYLENIISWWKKKASKRYEKLKHEGRFRDKVELWTEDDDIQIIR